MVIIIHKDVYNVHVPTWCIACVHQKSCGNVYHHVAIVIVVAHAKGKFSAQLRLRSE